MMIELGFPHKFINQVMECASSMSYPLTLNRALTKTFQPRRGLSRGDPMSPYLFVIVMEYLHREMIHLALNRYFHFHLRCQRFGLIHMCFTDDLLMFCRGNLISVSLLQKTLHKFSCAYGLKVNIAKSSIYMESINTSLRINILQSLGFMERCHDPNQGVTVTGISSPSQTGDHPLILTVRA